MAKTSSYKAATPTRSKRASTAAVVAPSRAPQGGLTVRASGASALSTPVGAGSGAGSDGSLLTLAADASGQFESIAPTFGNILSSVGLGVANSQAALDKGVIDTVKKLSNTKITVVTEVVEELDDDGLPDPDATQLITNELSVLNFVTPTVHEWKHVALSMDMSVGAMDNETGVTYNVNSTSSSSGSYGAFFGLIGIGYKTDSSSYSNMMANSDREAQWSEGVVQLDATLGPRRTGKFPTPASVSIGPQIFFSQGSVVETKVGGVVTERSIDVLINVRKASGAVNPSKPLELEAAGLLPSFSTTAPFTGSTTNADGQCKVTLRRSITPGFSQTGKRTLTVRLGQISKRFDIVI
jgi:hypothetical protein